jgi:hypothetical protein
MAQSASYPVTSCRHSKFLVPDGSNELYSLDLTGTNPEKLPKLLECFPTYVVVFLSERQVFLLSGGADQQTHLSRKSPKT